MFAAIFFVSVGMLIDPRRSASTGWRSGPDARVIIGKVLAVTIGAFLTGHGRRTSMQAGMSLAQIGEFSFIIAGVGVALRRDPRAAVSGRGRGFRDHDAHDAAADQAVESRRRIDRSLAAGAAPDRRRALRIVDRACPQRAARRERAIRDESASSGSSCSTRRSSSAVVIGVVWRSIRFSECSPNMTGMPSRPVRFMVVIDRRPDNRATDIRPDHAAPRRSAIVSRARPSPSAQKGESRTLPMRRGARS